MAKRKRGLLDSVRGSVGSFLEPMRRARQGVADNTAKHTDQDRKSVSVLRNQVRPGTSSTTIRKKADVGVASTPMAQNAGTIEPQYREPNPSQDSVIRNYGFMQPPPMAMTGMQPREPRQYGNLPTSLAYNRQAGGERSQMQGAQSLLGELQRPTVQGFAPPAGLTPDMQQARQRALLAQSQSREAMQSLASGPGTELYDSSSPQNMGSSVGPRSQVLGGQADSHNLIARRPGYASGYAGTSMASLPGDTAGTGPIQHPVSRMQAPVNAMGRDYAYQLERSGQGRPVGKDEDGNDLIEVDGEVFKIPAQRVIHHELLRQAAVRRRNENPDFAAYQDRLRQRREDALALRAESLPYRQQQQVGGITLSTPGQPRPGAPAINQTQPIFRQGGMGLAGGVAMAKQKRLLDAMSPEEKAMLAANPEQRLNFLGNQAKLKQLASQFEAEQEASVRAAKVQMALEGRTQEEIDNAFAMADGGGDQSLLTKPVLGRPTIADASADLTGSTAALSRMLQPGQPFPAIAQSLGLGPTPTSEELGQAINRRQQSGTPLTDQQLEVVQEYMRLNAGTKPEFYQPYTPSMADELFPSDDLTPGETSDVIVRGQPGSLLKGIQDKRSKKKKNYDDTNRIRNNRDPYYGLNTLGVM